MGTEFVSFPKMPRLGKTQVLITEKIDGTNAQIYIGEDGEFMTGSRNRWITPEDDNYGFSRWAHDNKDELLGLGPGRHYGEWWGSGIQRRYGLAEKRFSLFNANRWESGAPECCYVVPIIYRGPYTSHIVDACLEELRNYGSHAEKYCMNPEGIIVYFMDAKVGFKKMLENDDKHKGELA
jgi:hypothetical protein